MEDKTEYTMEEFAVAFSELCNKYKFTFQPEMGLKQQEDGTYTISIRLKVIPLPE